MANNLNQKSNMANNLNQKCSLKENSETVSTDVIYGNLNQIR